MAAMMRSISAGSAAFKPAAAPQLAHARSQRRGAVACRGVDPTVAAAVTQQAIAYALVLGAEGAFSYSAIPEVRAPRGRPQTARAHTA